MDNIQLVIQSNVGKQQGHTEWESYRALVTKLHSFLPTPLSESELEDLDIQEQGHSHQSLLALLYEELCHHNKALIKIHASLQILLSFFMGEVSFSAEIGQTLTTLSWDITPKEWMEMLMPLLSTDATMALIPVLMLLRSRVRFYTACLQSGMLPHTVNPLWLSSPADLLSRLLHDYALQNQLSCDEVMLHAKVS